MATGGCEVSCCFLKLQKKNLFVVYCKPSFEALFFFDLNNIVINKYIKIMATTYMTADGLQKLKEELAFLEGSERPRVIAAIAEAREKGDLSENAEYDAAKEEQGKLESRIAQLKSKIMDARIIDEKSINTDEVQILTRVRVRNKKNGMEKTYQLVTEGEANIAQGKLAVTTPIAKGLMGKKVGDIAQVQVPAGIMELEVLEISL